MIVDYATRTVRRLLVGKEPRFVFTRKENIAIPPLDMKKTTWLSHNRACCLVAHVTANEEHLQPSALINGPL